MASEAEWARDALGRGIPELGTDKALPAGGFPVVVSGMPPPLPQGVLAPARRRAGGGREGAGGGVAGRAAAPAREAGAIRRVYDRSRLAFAFLVLPIIAIIAAWFVPEN
jgi:hypothetical protein